MMLTIADTVITTKIYESLNSLVYRGYRKSDQQPIICKILKQDYPTPRELIRYRQEYEITHSLNLSNVIKVYSIEKYQRTLAIILEDFGGESLKILKERQYFTLTELLSIAVKITESLAAIHAANIIHKDINPSNIVYNPHTQQLKIIDFGLATLLPQENPVTQNLDILQGTLAYISPEQTGRMNRFIDYRTDFYSLGISLYELLTQQLPFKTNDITELVHCHLAQQPIPLHQINSDIPPVISEIVMKLLAKNAEDRYQSAWGIAEDLENCLKQLQKIGNIAPFIIAQKDSSKQFKIPQKLYGREQEIASLLAAFEKVSQGSTLKSSMMLVSGYSGVGKSALIQEVYKPLTQHRGYFVTGKFDQFKRNIPYSAFTQAFQELIRQLLAQNATQLQQWRNQLLDALGSNGQVIIDVISEVELIIGQQPSIPTLPAIESQNRFNLVFLNFINVFAQVEHPLVIFLDDLQWSDGASLQLIQLLMTASDSQFFLIGAYRNNEINETHPLILTINEITKAGTTVDLIYLVPLNLEQVKQLIVDTFGCSLDRSTSLAELVLAKTNGNPFFINEFLKSLYQEKLIYLDSLAVDLAQRWHWDLEQIQAQSLTDNVTELMVSKIQKLPVSTQQVLKLAACIDHQFALELLSRVLGKSPRETVIVLQEAVVERLILPLNEIYKWIQLELPLPDATLKAEYKFAHDRIQQAAYTLILPEDRGSVHQKIGQLLLQDTPSQQREQKIFDIVNQLNLGRELLSTQLERNELASLNLIAGQKAKESIAYQPASLYLQVGLELLETGSWQEDYLLKLSLYKESAEVAYLNADFAQMEQRIAVVLERAKTLLDKINMYQIKVQAYLAQNQLAKAIATALLALKFFGISFPENPSQVDVLLELVRSKLALGRRRIENLANLPEIKDAEQLAMLQLIRKVAITSYMGNPKLCSLINFKEIRLFIKYGNSSYSALTYSSYGLMLGGLVSDINAAYQFGQLALRLSQDLKSKHVQAMTIHLVEGYIKHWKEHARNTLTPFLKSYQIGIDTGDIYAAAGSAFLHCLYAYCVGEDLSELEPKMAFYGKAIKKLGQQTIVHYQQMCHQAVANLMGQSQNSCDLSGEFYDRDTLLPRHLETNDIPAIYNVYLHQLILCYLFQDYSQAIQNANQAQQYIYGLTGSLLVPLFYFYDSLAQLVLFYQVSKSKKNEILKRVVKNQKKLKKWAKYAPMNHLHKYYLVEAERMSVLGKVKDAREYYDRSIALAHEYEYLQEEALAYELAAKFYFAREQGYIASHYLHNAHYTYQRWGATAKVQHLESQYSDLLSRSRQCSFDTKTSVSLDSSSNTSSSVLDLNSVLKASQSISGEIVLEQLLMQLMKTVIENAGAQKGFLLLQKDEQWMIEATGMLAENIAVLQSIPLNVVPTDGESSLLSTAIINYVVHTQENVVLEDAMNQGQFTRDPYILATQPKSILCMPLIDQGRLTGILYLENNLTVGAFTADRLDVLKVLSSQAAISIKNAQLYQEMSFLNVNLQQEVSERQRAEGALRDSETKLTQFLEAVPVGIFVIDAQGKPYYANQTAQEILGQSSVRDIIALDSESVLEVMAEQLTQIYQVYQVGTDRPYPTEQQPIIRALNGENTTIDDMEIRRGDRVIPLEVSATPVFDDEGKIVYAIAAFTDISQRRQAETERITFTQELALKNIALQQAKDELADYSRTLEQKVTQRTRELSQTLDILKATQAELLFENALLRSDEMPSHFDYQVGGSLAMDAPTYVVRSADRHLYKFLKQGQFCYILNARQMGKSSLMVQMIHRLQQEGICCAAIDLTRVGSENITPDQWYKGIAVELWQSCNLASRFSLKNWWNEHLDVSPVQRLGCFIEEVLLVEVATEQPLVIFMDEIDSILSLNFSVNDFFALIRSCYNQRSLQPIYQHLTFVFLGVATPSDLITDFQRTPFNIGQAIQLEGFKEHEAQPLLQGIAHKVSNPQIVLKEVLFWTNGQPFLTQKLCHLIHSAASPISSNDEVEWIANLVQTKIIDNWESQDDPEHLKTIRDRLLKSKQSAQLLQLYRQIRHQENVFVVDSPEEKELLLSGVVIKQQDLLKLHNRIYQAIFNDNWLEQHL